MIPRFKPWLGLAELVALVRPNENAVADFEKEFAKKFEAVDAVAFPYGRSAQWAFFKALGIENAEIIMPAYTCSVVAHAVTLSGNVPRFIDISMHDYNMNLDETESAINEKTRAIIATHTFGYPQDLDRLEAMVKRGEKKYGHKIWLMQDCCHAFGAEWNGRLIGTSGDVAVYALNISKMITSIFGGMLTFQDQELADTMREWRNKHYRRASFWKSIQRRLYLLATYIAFNERIYGLTWWLQEKTPLLDHFIKSFHLDGKIHFPPDYKDLMMDVEASVGLAQLKRYDKIIERRRANAHWYSKHLPRHKGWTYPPLVEGATYSHYTIMVPDRKQVIDHWASQGIQMGELIQYSIPLLPEYTNNQKLKFINSEIASRHTINAPVTRSVKGKKTGKFL